MKLPKITDFKPTGSHVLVELINPEELIETTLALPGDVSGMVKGAPQGFVLAVGPAVNMEDWGFKVGDRVALDDRLIPLPAAALPSDNPNDLDAHGHPKRGRGLVLPSGVKCVLVQSDQGQCCGGVCKVSTD